MATPLPARPSLDWLRRRAKLLLKTLRRTRPAATLAEAQLALAREHGLPSWRALKAEVEARLAAGATRATPATPIAEETVAAFLRAVGAGDTDPVRAWLAEQPGLVNAVGPHPFWGGRCQALHVAVGTGRKPMVELLLRAGADPNGTNDGYMHWSPLMSAMGKDREPIRRLLLRRGARIGLVEALMLGDDRTVLRLLKAGHRALPAEVPNGGSLLMFARTPKAIDRLLELGVPLDRRDQWGATPVEALSRLGKDGRDLVRHLESRGVRAAPAEYARMGDRAALARLAASDPAVLREDAVMLGAVDGRHHALVRWLLKQGANANARAAAQSQHTALHSAAWSGDLAMVKLLVAAGADPASRDRQYDATPEGWAETAIEVTGNEKCRAVAAWLVSRARGRGASPDDTPAPRKLWTPIMKAAFTGDVGAVQRLLMRGADPNVLSNSSHRHRPLHRAIEHKKTLPKHDGHEEVVRHLLAAGADPRRRALATRLTALALAACDEPRFVPLLLPRFGELDLFHAAVVLDLARVRALLAAGADPMATDINTMRPLHYCAASRMFTLSADHAARQLAIAEALVAAGADVNAGHAYADSEWTLTALFHASGNQDNPALTEWLLDRGADPADGESVYHAADEGHERALAVLARKVAPEVLAAQATYALTGLLRWGRVRAVPWLLGHGADPNAIHERHGDAALHAAARATAGVATIELLLAHGARKDLRNREGLTAKDVARKAGHLKAVALL
ncbi:MAG TPA: ankyrin repeat domain-containing protein [Gemmatimonadales bacterium]|nr:ankyrin repeat domain-containing protein [Gemmatimonadales bacterium]